MKKISISLLSIALAMLMAFLNPVQIFAADVEYISEIRIGYGDSGREQLVKDGYIVWKNKNGSYLNVNDGGNGSAVYLGYKTTTQKEDAITDLAVMPMTYQDGAAFSFDEYAKEMGNLDKQINAQLAEFDAAIQEFRTNLAKPSPENDYALRAYTILNMYIEDDSEKPLGKLFANGEFDDTGKFVSYESEPNTTAYHNVLMMGNSTAVYAVKIALAIGCTETSGETFLDRLKNAKYSQTIPETLNSRIVTLASCIETFQDQLREAMAVCEEADQCNGGRDAYISALEVLSPQDVQSVIFQINLIDTMESTDYGDVLDVFDEQMSFLDVMMLTTDASSTDIMKLDATLLAMLAGVMTPGQIAMAKYIGLNVLINNANSTKLEKENGHFKLTVVDEQLETLKQYEPISVYLGVDRSVFADGNYKTVAITTAAIRAGIDNENFGVSKDYNSHTCNAKKVALYVATGVAAAAAIGCIVYACKNWNMAERTVQTGITVIPAEQTAMFKYVNGAYDRYDFAPMGSEQYLKKMNDPELYFSHCTTDTPEQQIPQLEQQIYTTTGTKVTAVVGVIFALIAIALAIVTLVESLKKTEVKVEYTNIPRAIIDVKKNAGECKYIVYYAARLAGASDDYINEKDTTKLYGDLNGLNGKDKWLCLYYAKDLRLSSPITPTMLKNTTGLLSGSQVTAGYVPIHDFFNNELEPNNTGYTPIDLNSTSTSTAAKKIYLFFLRDLNEPPITASLIDETSSFNWLTLVAFISGSVLATGATIAVFKLKKKKETVEA